MYLFFLMPIRKSIIHHPTTEYLAFAMFRLVYIGRDGWEGDLINFVHK